MDIAFSINKTGLAGLGATLTSLTRNCADTTALQLWFFCSGLTAEDKSNIASLLQEENFGGKWEYIDFNAEQTFGRLRALHGDWATYGRLLIPAFIKKEKVLYLDADLVILRDVLELKDIYPENALAAVYRCNVQWSLEHAFFVQKLHWDPATHYFNAGVLLYNLEAWHREHMDERIRELSQKYPNEFLSADQTLLNAAIQGKFDLLPVAFNTEWYPARIKPVADDNVIFHFVGSPKPWDMFGKMLHYGYDTWTMYNTPSWENKYGQFTAGKFKRTWRIRKSLLKNFKERYFEKN